MRVYRSSPLLLSRVRPLVAGLAIAFGADAATGGSMAEGRIRAVAIADFNTVGSNHPTASYFVRNCNDAGQDSLRAAVAAANGAGVDASIEFDTAQMQCGTITLSTGQIDVSLQNLTIDGPGPSVLTIRGGAQEGHLNRIFDHAGAGNLVIHGVTLRDAKVQTNQPSNAKGGCVRSSGHVELSQSVVTSCSVVSQGSASGGGIYASSGLEMVDSTISDCSLLSYSSPVHGGGASVEGTFSARFSNIVGNSAKSLGFPMQDGTGGGILATGASYAYYSTFGSNSADVAGAILTPSLRLENSTISQNVASLYGGALVAQGIQLYASTVAFNQSLAFGFVGGVEAAYVTVDSSILAFNVSNAETAAVPDDIKSGSGYLFGANNLIIASSSAIPPDTISACPRLGPLLDNGGRTKTHALLPASPAIDMGNGVAPLDFDQRGVSFTRQFGAGIDIGAYEHIDGSGDVINQSKFEACE